MNGPTYPAWAEWLRTRMASTHMSVAQLSQSSGVREATLRSYRAGQRKPPTLEKGRPIAAALLEPGESIQDAEASMRNALSQSSERRDYYQQLDSEAAVLRTMTLSHGPFANGTNLFVDRLFKRFFQLSSIRRQIVGKEVGFQLRKRLDMLDSGECDIATNLLGTLQRMKRSKFYWSPIRVSLGAVCLRPHLRQLTPISVALGFPNSRQRRAPLWPVVVDGEVGAVHAQQTLGLLLKPDPRHFVEDLDPVKLAARVRECDGISGKIACAITDEVTALAVARELGDDAFIVVPPTTAQSIQTCHLRRELPSHVQGVAISRKNRLLREYFDDAWTAMLQWEQESIASGYARLFTELTEYVTDCLRAGPVIGDSSGGVVDLRSMIPQSKELFVYRTARAYARRALQIDQRSIESFAQGSSLWRSILERTREKTLTLEAEDRLFVRERLRVIIEETLGEGVASPQTPADLRNVRPLLEQEFDVTLAESDLNPQPHHADDITVEKLTSRIQHAMERSSTVALHTTVSKARDTQISLLEGLREELRKELSEKQSPSTGQTLLSSFLAVYRGKFVGCVDIYSLENAGGYQLRNLFVKSHLRGHGVGRVLIRAALEEAAKENVRKVVIDLARVPVHTESSQIVEFFERNGFRAASGGDSLEYALS